METIGYGFLVGVGILLAVIALCLAVSIVVILGLFFGYVNDRVRRSRTSKDDDNPVG